MPVDWDAPEGCASEDAFVGRVLEQADVPEPAALSIAVSVRRLPDDRWRLALAIESDAGIDRREVEGESCDAVVEAAALIVSLRLVEAAQRVDVVPPSEPPAEPAPAQPEPAKPEPIAVAPTPEIVAPPPRRALPSGWLAASAGPALGILPNVGAGVSLEGGVQGELWRVGASARAFPVRRASHPALSGVDGRFDLVQGGVLGCGMPAFRRVVFPLCGRVDAGAMRGVGEGGGVTSPRPKWSPWLGLAGSAAVAWRVTRVIAPFVAAEGVVSLLRPSFSVGGQSELLFQAGRGGFRAWAGIEIHLPIRPGGASRKVAPRKAAPRETQ